MKRIARVHTDRCTLYRKLWAERYSLDRPPRARVCCCDS
jgi:hypothetical protein